MPQRRGVVDAHVHIAKPATLKVPGHRDRSERPAAGSSARAEDDALPPPEGLDRFFDGQGVDIVLLMSEHSPRVTGWQPPDDLLPLVEHDPYRYRLIGNVNPHLHYPVKNELQRQLQLGIVALKVHPVHGNFSADDRQLYPAYALCEEHQVPVVVHTGTSNFPGAVNRFGNPLALENVAVDFPNLTIVMAHGGRGWWYDTAAFLTQMRNNFWIDIAGLPPRRLPDYFARYDLGRLARRWIFGSDWPDAPAIGKNVEAVRSLGLPPDVLEAVLWGNARSVYRLDGPI